MSSFSGSSHTVNIPAARPPLMSDDWLSPIIAAWRFGHPSRSMATRKRVGSGLPIAIGSAPAAMAMAAVRAPQPGSKRPGPTGNRLSRLTANKVAPEATVRCCPQSFVIKVEVDSDNHRLCFLPSLESDKSVTGICQHLCEVSGTHNEHRCGP